MPIHIPSRFVHRHWVIAPVFALIVTVSLLPIAQRGLSFGATILATIDASSDTSFAFANGVSGIAYQGAIAEETGDGLTLGAGSALVRSDGVFRIEAGDISVVGFAGAAHITSDAASVTVVAVHGPLLLLRGTYVAFLPSGSQQTVDRDAMPKEMDRDASLRQTRQAIVTPQELADEYRAIVRTIPIAEPVRADAPVDLRLAPEDAAVWKAIRRLRSAVHSGDTAAVTAIVQENAVALSSLPGVVRSLLQSTVRESILAELLALLPARDVLTVLAPLHPALRAAAWAQQRRPDMYVLLLAPIADTLPQAAEPFVVERWKTMFLQELETVKDSVVLVATSLQIAETARVLFEEHAYPERYARYAEAFEELASPFADRLPEDAVTLLRAWHTDPIVNIPQEPEQTEVPISSAPAVAPVPFDARAVESTAAALLRSAGALFGLPTAVRAVSAESVAVSSLIFSAPDGEHFYDFSLSLADNTVSAIRKDGTAFALPMTLEAFAAWARGE